MNVKLANTFLEIEISSLGAELQSVRNPSGYEFMWQGDQQVWKWHAPILFPIAGKLKNDQYIYKGRVYHMPMHGFASKKEFTFHRLSENHIRFTLRSSQETMAMYPFEFVLRVSYELVDQLLKIRHEVINEGEDDLLFTLGSHEGYACEGDIEEYSLKFEEPVSLDTYLIEECLLLKETLNLITEQKKLPLKKSYFTKHALVFKDISTKAVTLNHRTRGDILTVRYPDHRNLLIWTKGNEPFVCIEPWIALSDYIDSSGELQKKENIQRLKQGDRYSCDYSIEYKFFSST